MSTHRLDTAAMLNTIAKIAILLAAFYLLSAVALYAFQRKLLYRPDPTRTPPALLGLRGVEDITLVTPDGERLVAWRTLARPGKPTLLYFHGNGGSLALRADRMRLFMAEGYGVLMMSYRGYSGSTGKPSEAANVADAELAHDRLTSEGIPASSIVVYGESLGSGVAVQLAVRRPVAAVILDAPFTSTADVARRIYPVFPVGAFLKDRYDSAARIARIGAPLLILHGKQDTVVPFELGARLYDLAAEPKAMHAFANGGHSDLYAHGAIRVVARFLVDHGLDATGGRR